MKISRELIGVRLLFSLSNKGTAIAKSSPLLPKLMKYKWATIINHSQTHIFSFITTNQQTSSQCYSIIFIFD